MRWPLLLLLAGCDRFFGLSSGKVPDAETIDASTLDAEVGCVHRHATLIGDGDFDGDGEDNCHDPCPLDPTITSATPNLTDGDGDGIPDACDPDAGGGGTAFPDCLLVIDDFDDNNHASPLDARWKSNSSTGVPWAWQPCPPSNRLGFCSPPGVANGVLYFDDDLANVTFITAKANIRNERDTFSLFSVIADGSPDGTDLDGRSCDFVATLTPQCGVQDEDRQVGHPPANQKATLVTKAFVDNSEIELVFEPKKSSTCEELSFVNQTTTSNVLPPPELGRIAVRVQSFDAEVHAIAAYGSSDACK